MSSFLRPGIYGGRPLNNGIAARRIVKSCDPILDRPSKFAQPANGSERWWPEVCYAPVAMQRLADGSKRVVLPFAANEALAGSVLRQFVTEHPDCEIAVEPPKLADWLGWDIDAASIYRSAEAIAQLRAVADQWGATTFIASSSLHPDGTVRGLRVYAFLGHQFTRHQRAALAAWWAWQAEMDVAAGQLELIPQLKAWTAGRPGVTQRFSPPFQTDQSTLLEDDLTTTAWQSDDCIDIVNEMAEGVDAHRVAEAVVHALDWHKYRRRFSGARNRLQAVSRLRGVVLASGASNGPLVALAADYVARFSLNDDIDAPHHAPAFLAELQSRSDYRNCSANTRADLERSRACRLLLCAIRFRRGDRRRGGDGSAAALASTIDRNHQKQVACLQNLLKALDYARRTWWRSGRQLCAWLERFHKVSRRWLMGDLIKPLWQWVVSDPKQPSSEFRQASDYIARALEQPEGGEESFFGERYPHSSIQGSAPLEKNDSDPAVPLPKKPVPAWVEGLRRALRTLRADWVEARRVERKAANAARYRDAAAQRRERRADRQAGVVLCGVVSEATAAAASAADDDFWASMGRGPLTAAQPPAPAAEADDATRFESNGIWRRFKAAQGKLRSLFKGWTPPTTDDLATAPAAAPGAAEEALAKAQTTFRWDAAQQVFLNIHTGTVRTVEAIALIYGCDAAELLNLMTTEESA